MVHYSSMVLKLLIPRKPLTVNQAYINIRGQNRRFLSSEARAFKNDVLKCVSGKKLIFNEKTEFISIEYYFYLSKMLTANQSIRKRYLDWDGLIKLTQDSIFEGLGVDDSFICEALVKKIPSDQDKIVVIIKTELATSIQDIVI